MQPNQMEITSLKDWIEKGQVFIDVRSPVEFQQGHLPGSINAPILDNAERALIGVTYKNQGRDVAVRLGHDIVSGENRARKIQVWKNILTQHPDAIFTCFRGGMRSQITQAWMKAEGYDRPLIKGGYKVARQALLDQIDSFSQNYPFLLVSGPTGAGKTSFLGDVQKTWPTIQLEAYAEHRGSAFGGWGKPQPSQAVFENRLGWDLHRFENQVRNDGLPLIMEDESRLIGRCVLPEVFFKKLRESPIIWLDVSIDQRVENTYEEYILRAEVNEDLFSRYKVALSNIQNRLGGLLYREILSLIEAAELSWKSLGQLEENKLWIKRLLVDYYDPLYFGSLARRNPHVLFKGSPAEVLDFLNGQKSKNKEKAVNTKA